ncbi:DNA polymerase III subunit beta [Xanthobacter autotrophicus]|uniref:DNA polymerase III subunit beta n=1 Tax=Xanthobacter autotrophicus TaxID=280 RepID=UPI003729C40B
MQIAHLPRAPFRAALASIIKAVPRKDPHPILSTVLIEERDGAVILRATDLAMEASAVITGAVAPVGFATCLPARQLRDAEKNAPASTELVVSVQDMDDVDDSATPAATLTFGALSLTMPAREPSDFPRLKPCEEAPVSVTLPRAALRGGLVATEFAISTEETRYYLGGIFLHPSPDGSGLRMASTDGHRLAVHDVPLEDAPQFAGVILPRDAVALLLPVLKGKGAPEMVAVDITAKQVAVRAGGVVIRSKVVDGTYPDYARCIPSEDYMTTRATLDRRATINALKGLVGTTDKRGRAVGLSFESSTLALWASADSTGAGAQVSVACEVTGHTLDIGFNSRYLLDILSAMSGDVVTVEMQDAGAPARIHEPDGTMYVLMPMRVGCRPARPASAPAEAPCPAPGADAPQDAAPALPPAPTPPATVVPFPAPPQSPARRVSASAPAPDGAAVPPAPPVGSANARPHLVAVATATDPRPAGPSPTEAMSGAPRPPTGGASCTRRRPDTTRAAGAGLRMAHPPGGGVLCAAPPPTEEIRRRAAAPMAAALDARLAGPPMPPRKVVTLGDVRRIPLGVYVAAWRLVRAAPPDARFRGSPCGWSGSEETAAEILRQFRAGMDDRINRHVPWHGRGRRWGPDWQSEAARLARAVNTPRLVVRWAPQEFRRRLAHRLEDAS